MVETQTTFDEYKVTNASIQWFDGKEYAPGVPLGCTGKLELETELKSVVKKCEGDESYNIPFYPLALRRTRQKRGRGCAGSLGSCGRAGRVGPRG